MSRHVLVDRPDCYVVLGFDRPLQSLFGLRYRAKNKGAPIAGWPTKDGLGTRRPAVSYAQMEEDLGLLILWAQEQQPLQLWREREPAGHLSHLRHTLFDEWQHNRDHGSRKPPPSLTGPLS